MRAIHKIKLLIADDHDLYLDGLKNFLDGNSVYEVVGEAVNGEDLVRKAINLAPHVILTDLRMPQMSGAAAIKQIVTDNSSVRCLVLTNYDNEYSIVEALEAGAIGYITKNMPKEELIEALDQVSRGHPYYCQTTSTKMIRLLAKSNFDPYIRQRQSQFSETEKTIIRLVCQEMSNLEISQALFMSIRTIENNRSRIMKKMNVKTAAGVAIYAIKNDLFFLKDA